MKRLMMAAAILMLVGCAAQQHKYEEQRSKNQEFRSQLIDAIKSGASVVKCPNKPVCDKAFSLAKIYVQENSDMRIQMSDDTLVSTYGSTEYGYISLQASKIPDAGSSSIIQLKAFCKDVDDSFETVCMRREAMIIRGFKPYIESRIQ